ncbi:uncharacterized protein EI90DRAFT_3051342 [Cantharellus anzutake]|uniref:uncharacterized protein n=1 Tax=Cantharellus anzutake TaxID=1750568 RepID=UPI001906E7C9|nr:uncharacterized protein EI90DRAFT_3051342 [Cantharellus anzutake]KAF8334170.1 hypothetical protein EI90DRAFT_3051342 [Cantharellus anzutake]
MTALCTFSLSLPPSLSVQHLASHSVTIMMTIINYSPIRVSCFSFFLPSFFLFRMHMAVYLTFTPRTSLTICPCNYWVVISPLYYMSNI